MRDIELLAPAGSYEAFIAAIQNGANAIYLGGNAFSARAFATNFTREQLQEAVHYAHLRQVRIYVTVNTLYQDEQFEELLEYIHFLYTIQIDALIIQDIGLVKLVKEKFPDFEIHMSTQASIYNLAGVQYFEDLQIQRVVLSRENTIEEIKDICSHTTKDIEVFVHGALCMGYSGQCLMSSFIGKRSGNKGMCAQPCRLGYRLQKDSQFLNNKESFLLSPKDLCTIENIGLLIDAGVTSFKIEGRMKRPEYVATIVKAYRQAIDCHLQKQKIENLSQSILDMKKMFNRGFTKGYLFHDTDFMAKQYPGNRGVLIGKVIGYHPTKKRVAITLNQPLKQNDRIVFNSKDLTRTVTKLYLNNRLVNQANKGDTIEIEMDQKIPKMDLVYKIVDSQLLTIAKSSYQKEQIQIPITMHFSGAIGSVATLSIKDTNQHQITVTSNALVEQAMTSPLMQERIEQQLRKLGNTVYTIKDCVIDFEKQATISIKEINQLRREAVEKLNQCRENSIIHFSTLFDFTLSLTLVKRKVKKVAVKVTNLEQLQIVLTYPIDTIFYPIHKTLTTAIALASKENKKIIPYTGFMIPDKALTRFIESESFHQIDSVLVGDYGSLQRLKPYKECILDTHFNIYNSYAATFFKEHRILVSLEMSAKQMRHLSSTNPEVITTVYGKIENMVSKYCPISEHYFNKKVPGCNKCKEGNYCLVDRKNEHFDILMDDNCFMHLLNSHPLYIDAIDKINADTILLAFTKETQKEVKTVIEDYLFTILQNKKSQHKTNIRYTSGYFND